MSETSDVLSRPAHRIWMRDRDHRVGDPAVPREPGQSGGVFFNEAAKKNSFAAKLLWDSHANGTNRPRFDEKWSHWLLLRGNRIYFELWPNNQRWTEYHSTYCANWRTMHG